MILLVLIVSEMGNNHPVDDVWLRLSAILLTTFTVPMLAAFQTVIVTRKLKDKNCDLDKIPATLKRLTACHSAVWLIASLAIVYSFQWQKIVRGNWQLDQWWLIDDILIIAPVILSLIASWAIFFDIQTVFAKSEKLKSLGERFKFVGLRVRVYLAIFLIPMLFALAAKDVMDSRLFDSKSLLLVIVFAGTPILLATFPFLVAMVWQTKKLEDTELKDSVQKIVEHHKLRIFSVRIWTTSRQIINAVVAGVFPYFRLILISDGLVNNFTTPQIAAIIRHEAGHIRRHHLLLRMFFVLLPLFIFLLSDWLGYHPEQTGNKIMTSTGLSESLALPIMTLAYGGYLFLSLAWLSRQMEFDADQYAVTQHANADTEENSICKQAVEDMESALLRFAELMPSQVDRKSLWHPTIRQRLIRLAQLKQNPNFRKQRSEDFFYQQVLLFTGIVVFAVLFFTVIDFFGI